MQQELKSLHGDSSDVKDGGSGTRGAVQPQDPLSNPRSPCTSTPLLAPATRSYSDSEAMLEEQGAAMRLKGPTESLFLDALSLDPLSLEVPPPSRLESEKRFPCMKEVPPPPPRPICVFYHFYSHFVTDLFMVMVSDRVRVS